MAGHIGDMVSQHWNTPIELIVRVRKVFWGQIDLDPCDNDHSLTKPTIGFRYPHDDGLKRDWDAKSLGIDRATNVYCNPPFGRTNVGTSIEDWIEKCSKESKSDYINSIILLCPSSTEATFWHKYIWPTYDSICFLKGRISFLLRGKRLSGATKGTAIIYWGPTKGRFKEYFQTAGHVI